MKAEDAITTQEKFYANFNDEGFYNVEDLVILGVMLSTGHPAAKAAVLYDHVDENWTHYISLKDWNILLKRMIHISVEVTLLLGIGELQDAKLPEQRILKYQEMIRD